MENSISIDLLDSYFLLENVTCFCETCHKLRAEEPYFKKGDPPKEFAQPFGWCRFPLRYEVLFFILYMHVYICITCVNRSKNFLLLGYLPYYLNKKVLFAIYFFQAFDLAKLKVFQ